MCVIKRELKFKNYQHNNTENQLDNHSKIFRENGFNTDIINNNMKNLLKNNKLTLTKQQRSKSESHNVFAEQINKIYLSSNDDKRVQSIDSIETYAYGTKKDLISETEEIKCNNIIKQFRK